MIIQVINVVIQVIERDCVDRRYNCDATLHGINNTVGRHINLIAPVRFNIGPTRFMPIYSVFSMYISRQLNNSSQIFRGISYDLLACAIIANLFCSAYREESLNIYIMEDAIDQQ